MLTLTLWFRRMWYLLKLLVWRKPYVVYSTPKGFKRALLREHNRRRERGNVALYLGKRSGRFHVTN